MAFEAITEEEIAQDQAITQPLMEKIRGNFDALHGSLGTVAGSGGGGVPNGSFEIDSDANGDPDSWTRATQYPGGSHALDTVNVAHGGKSLKITSPGGANNGGEAWDSDYIPCSPVSPFLLEVLMMSDDAGLRNVVEVRWFKKDKVASAVRASDTLYDSAVAPTSWRRLLLGCSPPSDGCFCKLRITGAKAETFSTPAGSTWFDGLAIHKQSYLHFVEVEMPPVPEATTTALTYTDVGSPVSIPIGATVPGDTVTVFITADAHGSGASSAWQRFRFGSIYSTEIGPVPVGAYVSSVLYFSFISSGEHQIQVQQQLKVHAGVDLVYGRVSAPTAVVKVSRPGYPLGTLI